MFKYAFLILLPALAFAAIDFEALLLGLLDTNKDGKISITETETFFMTFDTNSDGDVTLAEFVAVVDQISPAIVGHESILFNLLDRDGNGKVNKLEIDAAFHIADLNKDSFIKKSEIRMIIAFAGSRFG